MLPMSRPRSLNEVNSSAELLKTNQILNTIMGLPIFVIPETSKKYIQIFSIYQRTSELIVTIGVIGQIWAIPYIYHDMNILCACLSSGNHSLQVILKTLLLRSAKTRFYRFIRATDTALLSSAELEQLLGVHIYIPSFESYYRKEGRYAQGILLLLFTTMIVSTTAYFIPIDIESIMNWRNVSGQLTPIVVYYPIDFMRTPWLQLINIFLTCCFYLVNLKTIVMESFILALIVLQTVQYQYLKILLDAIMSLSDLSVKFPHNKHFLKIWLRLHQNQLRITKEFATILSPYLLLEYGYIFSHTCVPAFVITSTLSWTLPQKFAVFFIMGAGIALLLFMSRAADHLTDSSTRCCESLYRLGLIVGDRWYKYVINLATLRAQHPIKLAAATVIPLCCPTFITVMRLILSYYMTLNEVQKMKFEKET